MPTRAPSLFVEAPVDCDVSTTVNDFSGRHAGIDTNSACNDIKVRLVKLPEDSNDTVIEPDLCLGVTGEMVRVRLKFLARPCQQPMLTAVSLRVLAFNS